MKSVRRRKTGRTNDPNYKKTHCANYHPTDCGASHPRPCPAARPGVSQHSSRPGARLLALPGTLLWHCGSKGDASPAARFMPHSISRGLSLLPTLLPFLFPPPCLFCSDWWRARRSSSSWGMSHAPNIVTPIKSKPGCLLL